ncbi:MAG: HPP family protein [Pseudomonadales bacterium]
MALMIFDKGVPSPAKLRETPHSSIVPLQLNAVRTSARQSRNTQAIYTKPHPSATSNQTQSYQVQESADSLDNRRRLNAAHIMSSPVQTVTVHDLVTHAKDLMTEKDISHLIVVDPQQRPLTILNYASLLKIDKPEHKFVQHLLTEHTLAVSADTLVRDIALSFVKYKATAIAVVDKQPSVVGIIARSDLLNLLVSGPNQQLWA